MTGEKLVGGQAWMCQVLKEVKRSELKQGEEKVAGILLVKFKNAKGNIYNVCQGR